MKQSKTGRIALATLLMASAAALVNAQAAKSDKPRIAVLEVQPPTQARSNRESLYAKVSDVKLDVVRELAKIGTVQVLTNKQVDATARRNKLSLTADPDKATAVRIGKLLGVNYLWVSKAELELRRDAAGATTQSVLLTMTAFLIDTSTGEIAWTGEASHDEPLTLSGMGSNVRTAERKALDLAIPRVVEKLVASARDANLFS